MESCVIVCARARLIGSDGGPTDSGASGLLEFAYLHGYSPELNPAEYANNDTKHGVLTK